LPSTGLLDGSDDTTHGTEASGGLDTDSIVEGSAGALLLVGG
jgi:hypothetical protein